MKYLEAMLAGKEVVIIHSDNSYSSAIFWMDHEFNSYVFSKEVGVIKRPPHEFTKFDIIDHFAEMQREGATLYIRGTED